MKLQHGCAQTPNKGASERGVVRPRSTVSAWSRCRRSCCRFTYPSWFAPASSRSRTGRDRYGLCLLLKCLPTSAVTRTSLHSTALLRCLADDGSRATTGRRLHVSLSCTSCHGPPCARLSPEQFCRGLPAAGTPSLAARALWVYHVHALGASCPCPRGKRILREGKFPGRWAVEPRPAAAPICIFSVTFACVPRRCGHTSRPCTVVGRPLCARWA